MWNTPVEVQFTSAGCLNYPCRTPEGNDFYLDPPDGALLLTVDEKVVDPGAATGAGLP
jgi:hypothetical protein